MGAAIDFGLVADQPGLIVGLMVGLIALKFVVLFILGRVFKMGLDQNLLFAFSLAQSGEFAFVLFAFAVREGVVETTIATTLIAVVALSMAVAPVLMLINEKLVQPRFGTPETDSGEADEIDEESTVIIAGFGSFGSGVGRLLRANGVNTTVLDLDPDRVDLLRKLGIKVFYGDASRHDLLHAAGAAEARLMVLALDSLEKNLELVETARKHIPNLELMARAGDRSQAYELIDAGVEHVFREKLDSSLRLGARALRLLGRRAYQAHRAARTFRRHDEEALLELVGMRHDKKLYLNTARQRIQDLEDLLLSDLEEAEETRDAGWDTESLRQEFGGDAGT